MARNMVTFIDDLTNKTKPLLRSDALFFESLTGIHIYAYRTGLNYYKGDTLLGDPAWEGVLQQIEGANSALNRMRSKLS